MVLVITFAHPKKLIIKGKAWIFLDHSAQVLLSGNCSHASASVFPHQDAAAFSSWSHIPCILIGPKGVILFGTTRDSERRCPWIPCKLCITRCPPLQCKLTPTSCGIRSSEQGDLDSLPSSHTQKLPLIEEEKPPLLWQHAQTRH
jgi:hypothetical protein